MVIRASAPAKGINHLPALWANECLPPRMIDTQCGLKTYDGKRRDKDIVHSQRPLTCEPCRECNREIIDGIEQQVLADEGIRLIGITDAGESSRAS